MHVNRPDDSGEPTASDGGVVVEGETPLRLPRTPEAADESYEVQTETTRFQCSSGDWLVDDWTGVPLQQLLSAATVPPETTHIIAEAADGYRSCLDVVAVGDAMVALDATDRPPTDFPRLVSASVGGPRAVKNLARIRPVTLDADEDPEDYEDLQLEDP